MADAACRTWQSSQWGRPVGIYPASHKSGLPSGGPIFPESSPHSCYPGLCHPRRGKDDINIMALMTLLLVDRNNTVHVCYVLSEKGRPTCAKNTQGQHFGINKLAAEVVGLISREPKSYVFIPKYPLLHIEVWEEEATVYEGKV